MKNSIKNALQDSFSYPEYREHIATLLADGKVTGHTQSEALLGYTQLNETRMNRLDKTLAVLPEVQEQLNALPKTITWLVLAEGWCGDAAQILPVLNKTAEATDKVVLKIVLRDDHDDLMNLFLTNGGKAIPKVILWDADAEEVIGSWGPRPEPARKMIADYKAEHGVVDEPIKVELQKWYLKDKGETTQRELLALIEQNVLVE
ncbi:thioredoxin family protein [Flavobacterium sp. NRK F10]|uniref:Thioredoxin family protein n=1 Tax=Flavobacterium sediminis TaxID=2201181 RepID=A0A2U8QVB2_9FLAO|nr:MULTISPECIES: thioredoxin family protein [Flavobacterium]AWM13814.1 thioredoxin family protein [Flavobacterium sediminis]MCO6174975.1 thioredoxin family protein [Flavobacterium sp. NRK F10]